MVKFGIVIPTYYRSDGQTRQYLLRALYSIQAQTYQGYRVYVIGDDYERENEFYEIGLLFPIDKFVFVNFPESKERQKYPFGDYRLFCVSGLTPGKRGVDWALKEGHSWICHLDHDDWWEPNHLEKLSKGIHWMGKNNVVFLCTVSSYYCPTYKGDHLPNVRIDNHIISYFPRNQGCILSSACIKYSDINVRARDVFEATGQAFPSDADFWIRLAEDMKKNGKTGYLITSLTCHHDEEGYSYKQ